MFIGDKQYRTPVLTDLANIRNLLFNHFYVNPEMISCMQNIISSHLDCEEIIFDPNSYSFNLKVRQSLSQTDLYYPIIQQIYTEFLTMHKSALIKILYNHYPNPYEILDNVLKNLSLCALCNVAVIGQNLVLIKL